MKRLALILAFLMLVPCSAFGMQMLSNSNMDKITGQAGVSIAMDDVQLFMHIDTIAYIDSDGLDTNGLTANQGVAAAGIGQAGAVGINDFTLNVLNFNAIVGTGQNNAGFQGAGTPADYSGQHGNGIGLVSSGNIPLFYNYATSATAASYLTGVGAVAYGLSTNTYSNPMGTLLTGYANGAIEPKFLTIDVSNILPCATMGLSYLASQDTTLYETNVGNSTGSVGGVIIGIPTAEIYIQQMVFTPFYTGNVNGVTHSGAANDVNLDSTYNYGTIQMSGITVTPLSGWIEIAPH